MLEAKDIRFAYPGCAPLYEGVSLSVAPGERVALSAPSGFGKTTLCQVLAGYLAPQAGTVTVDGEPLPRRGRCPVQMIWQHPERACDPRLRMRDTLAEAGVTCAKVARGARAGDLSELVENPEHARLLESLGIRAAWLSRYPHELSGGELQRFCIARALAARPRYLIADEMTTMLDALTQAQIWRALLAEVDARGMGLVFVSHSPALTERIATRVVDMTRGRVQ